MKQPYRDFSFWRAISFSERYMYIIYSRAWSPDVPICEWIVPGTWESLL